MAPYVDDIESATLSNSFFRKVLHTGKFSQLVVMSLKPGEEIGSEVHNDIDQFFRFEAGTGKVIIDNVEYEVKADMAVVIPAGSWHNVINTGSEDLRLYTIYSPPEHKPDTIHKTKEEALADHHDH